MAKFKGDEARYDIEPGEYFVAERRPAPREDGARFTVYVDEPDPEADWAMRDVADAFTLEDALEIADCLNAHAARYVYEGQEVAGDEYSNN